MTQLKHTTATTRSHQQRPRAFPSALNSGPLSKEVTATSQNKLVQAQHSVHSCHRHMSTTTLRHTQTVQNNTKNSSVVLSIIFLSLFSPSYSFIINNLLASHLRFTTPREKKEIKCELGYITKACKKKRKKQAIGHLKLHLVTCINKTNTLLKIQCTKVEELKPRNNCFTVKWGEKL